MWTLNTRRIDLTELMMPMRKMLHAKIDAFQILVNYCRWILGGTKNNRSGGGWRRSRKTKNLCRQKVLLVWVFRSHTHTHTMEKKFIFHVPWCRAYRQTWHGSNRHVFASQPKTSAFRSIQTLIIIIIIIIILITHFNWATKTFSLCKRALEKNWAYTEAQKHRHTATGRHDHR